MQDGPDLPTGNVSFLSIWHLLRQQSEVMAVESPVLAAMLQRRILGRASFEDALVQGLVDALRASAPADIDLVGVLGRTLAAHDDIADAAQDDLLKLARINPASTLTQVGDRHPKVRHGATLGAGATVLGNIEVGEGAVVAAGSVVLHGVDPFTRVAGVPAKPVGAAKRSLDVIAGKS